MDEWIIWPGYEPLVIGEVDDSGNVVDEIIVLPGARIPERAFELIRAAQEEGGIRAIPRGGPYDRAEIKAIYLGPQ